MRRTVVLAIAAIALAGCSGRSTPPGTASATPTTPAVSSVSATPPPSTTPPAAAERTVWLCRPGHRPDPCIADLTTTVMQPDGGRSTAADPQTTRHPKPAPADCFYVYPTVSGEPGPNADLRIQAAERQVAFAQASWFSAVCDVWAPMYRQRTLGDLFNLTDGQPDSDAHQVAFASLRQGWLSFLAQHDPSRPIVLIGHSQGASMLIRLLRQDVDHQPGVRSRIALAIILGGNLTVADHRNVGGDFQHLPLCSAPAESGCVIAYSSFARQPPIGSFFGRPGQGVSLLSGDTRRNGLHVACVNPARPGSTSSAPLHPYVPSALADSGASTPWTAYPGFATAQCRSAGGATWLQVAPTAAGRDAVALLHQRLGGLWGLHDIDVNLSLGDLVDDVAASVARWHSRH